MIPFMVPQGEIMNAWSVAEALIRKALDRDDFREDMADIFADLTVGRRSLWAIFDEESNSIITALLVRVVSYPKGNVLYTEYLGGERADEWFPPLVRRLEEYGKSLGCIAIEASGRDGWKKAVEAEGGKKVASVFRIEL